MTISNVARRGGVTGDDVRDFAGVAAGVAAGALAWLAMLSLMRLPA